MLFKSKLSELKKVLKMKIGYMKSNIQQMMQRAEEKKLNKEEFDKKTDEGKWRVLVSLNANYLRVHKKYMDILIERLYFIRRIAMLERHLSSLAMHGDNKRNFGLNSQLVKKFNRTRVSEDIEKVKAPDIDNFYAELKQEVADNQTNTILVALQDEYNKLENPYDKVLLKKIMGKVEGLR